MRSSQEQGARSEEPGVRQPALSLRQPVDDETVFVTDPENKVFRYLVLDAVCRMKRVGCVYLRIELREGKVIFEALPVLDGSKK